MPRVVDHERRRVQIAEAAWRVIEREGPDKANLREIAREAGYTTGVITHYFSNKQQLMAFAFELLARRQVERMARSAERRDLTDALAQFLPLDEERRRETSVWLALLGASLKDPDFAAELRWRYQRMREAAWPLFKEALEEGNPDIETAADELLAIVDGITVDALIDPERYTPERQLSLLRRSLERLGIRLGPQPHG
ncbi:transcriptional regulator, TetR family [Rubrobacter xylanophilus DSM 9941]|uniref:Transcriptional regulator, TetR family n=1 Tax=Rubrobacter xylanophilus (strain DSM 9941 / JCM 11954 / NBRC 16129 / PRD-1) TaxID=266117 RepID=Q1AZC2_RUBXD|nr:TetR family transcriptional regulator C-terminal domain-containing protein [Rubrobacter xylanophilus]ABG03256.1 transcriptional regulator, TetR family [Rubrobacter xylanophilus DSM 9941]